MRWWLFVRKRQWKMNIPALLLEPLLPELMYFFCLALQFWNQTCVTRFDRPVIWAIRSRSCPSGLESIWKLACNIWTCSSVKVVRILLVFFFDCDSDSPLSARMIKKPSILMLCLTANQKNNLSQTIFTYHQRKYIHHQLFPYSVACRGLGSH